MFKFLAAALICTASATSFNKCYNSTPPLQLSVSGCELPPCRFFRGKDVSVEISFIAQKDIEWITPRVIAKFSDFLVPFVGVAQNVCDKLITGKCPLAPGDKATYKETLPILPQYPLMDLNVQWLLVDNKRNVIVCFEIPIQLLST